MTTKNALRMAMGMAVIGVAPAARADLAIGPFLPSHIWPVSTADVPDRTISSTFGPRLRMSTIYEFHRGIDIPAPLGTPIYAVADGKVRIAGSHPGYDNPVIQIRHYKPGSGGSCDNRGCYYSNYLHVSSSTVAVDQTVSQGDLIGYTGQSDAGFQHLHFEIRDGGLNRRDCIHPLAVLPFSDMGAPPVTPMSVDLSQMPDTLVVDASVTLPPAELDLNRVEVIVFDTSGGRMIRTDSASYDFNEWNRLYSSPPGEPDTFLNDPTFGGVVVTPSPFKAGTPQYRIDFSFERPGGSADPAFLLLQVRAIDVAGHVTEAYFP